MKLFIAFTYFYFIFGICLSQQYNSLNITNSDTIAVFVVFAEKSNSTNYNSDNANWPKGQMPVNPGYLFDDTLIFRAC